MLHADVSVRDDDGRALPPGEQGTVWLRSETLMTGYLNAAVPGSTAAADPLSALTVASLKDLGYKVSSTPPVDLFKLA